jgi:hypothetical protein
VLIVGATVVDSGSVEVALDGLEHAAATSATHSPAPAIDDRASARRRPRRSPRPSPTA